MAQPDIITPIITPMHQRLLLAEAWRAYIDHSITWPQWRRLRALILGTTIPTAEEAPHA